MRASRYFQVDKRHNQVEAIQRLRDARRNISVSLSLLRTSIDGKLIANLEETQEQLDCDLGMISEAVNKETD